MVLLDNTEFNSVRAAGRAALVATEAMEVASRDARSLPDIFGGLGRTARNDRSGGAGKRERERDTANQRSERYPIPRKRDGVERRKKAANRVRA
jgi:hypothetical protein